MQMDIVIPMILTVLALMMINERIVEIFKRLILPLIGKILSSKEEGTIKPGILGILASLNIRMGYEPAYEEKRNQLIVALNFLIGWGVAGCAWSWIGPFLEHRMNFKINPVTGSFYAGILLSFGSKFWHDVLDLLCVIKNTRRSPSSDGNTQDMIKVKMNEKAMAEAVIHEEKRKLIAQYGSALVELTPLLIKWPNENSGFKYVIGAYFQEKRPSGFPDYFRVPGTNIWIMAKAIEGIGLPKAQCRPGSFLRNTNIGQHGSYGCVIRKKNNQYYILTAAHVITDQPGKTCTQDVVDQVRVWIAGTNEVLPVSQYEFAGAMGTDYALIGPVDERYTNTIGQQRKLQTSREISALDEGMIVTTSLTRHTFISERSCLIKQHHIAEQVVLFQDGSIHTLRNLIRLDKISMDGDSGAMIYDQHNRVIGMIVASDLAFTYAIKIESILAQLTGAYEIVQC